MLSMINVDNVKDAIEKALRRESKLTPLAISVPALSSLNIRHLMNNLGAISEHYMEHGVHRGGLFCSTIFKNNNLKSATAVDSFESDVTNNEGAEKDFLDNVKLCGPLPYNDVLWHNRSFDVDPKFISNPIDLYLFDADHSEDSQCKALTHFISAMADEFIFCVDDYDWKEVQEGTERGIVETGVEVLFSSVWKGNDHDNEGAWNGFAVFLLKKKA